MSYSFLDPFSFNNGLTLKNRILMAPMTTSSSTPEGNVTEDELIYYLVRSSGPSAIITACAYISSEGQAFENGMGISKDEHVESLRKLATTIQLQGAKAICQIYHGGRMAKRSFNGGKEPIAPSSVRAERKWADTPRPLSESGIHILIAQFGRAVKRAIDAGFDGVELHGANTYLLQQFFSPHSNQRSDSWGGSLENRMRFPLAVVKHCQEIIEKYANKPFVLGYRLSPEEIEEPGIRLSETFTLIDHLIETDIDYLHLSVQYYFQPSLLSFRNYREQVPQMISQHINNRVPLIGVGNVRSPEDANKVREYADLVSLGRQLIIDPKWVQKVEEKQSKEINRQVDTGKQYELHIPTPLWNQIVHIPNWFPVKKNPSL
jgi:2,4-dienoyl-CoA reductase-like NADH-dependent reductase (Old Yellow Enzyme family)